MMNFPRTFSPSTRSRDDICIFNFDVPAGNCENAGQDKSLSLKKDCGKCMPENMNLMTDVEREVSKLRSLKERNCKTLLGSPKQQRAKNKSKRTGSILSTGNKQKCSSKKVTFAEQGQIVTFDKSVSIDRLEKHSCSDMVDINFHNKQDYNPSVPDLDYRPYILHHGKRRISIFGDFMIERINYLKIRKHVPNSHVSCFSFKGGTTNFIKHSTYQYRSDFTDTFVIHTGTNDLQTGDSGEEIAANIISFAKSLKRENNEVVVSSLIERKGDSDLAGKVLKVNEMLEMICHRIRVKFCKNDNIYAERHLDHSGLKLNKIGEYILENNLIDSLCY